MPEQHPNKQLRSFGLTVGGVFLAIGAWPYIWRAHSPRLWALVLGGLLLLPGLVWPAVLNRPFKLWMGLAHILGWINTRIILGIVFYTVFTPAAFIMRLMGKDPMTRAFDTKNDTYRVLKERRAAAHMRHQS